MPRSRSRHTRRRVRRRMWSRSQLSRPPAYRPRPYGEAAVKRAPTPCKDGPMARPSEPSPYVEFDRAQWRELRKSIPLPLTEEELFRLRGLGEQLDLTEVAEVYLPLARLIHLQV